MTVQSVSVNPRRVVLTGDGVLTDFDFDFKIFSENEIAVYEAGVLKDLTTDYTVSFDTEDETGTVSFLAAPADEAQVLIIGSTPYSQETDIPKGGGFSEPVIEQGLDLLAIQIQQLKEITDRSLLLPVSSAVTGISLPEPSAGQMLIWNDDEDGFENVDSPTDAVAAAEAAQIAAETAQTAAETAQDLAEDWASKEEDAIVEGSEYSAKHYAAKAAAAAEAAETVAGWDVATQEEAETGTDNAKVMTPLRTVQSIAENVYPVGSIYINATDDTNPGTLLGFGTWEAFGAGRVPVGFDSGDTDFDTAEETGGAKTHTLTQAQLPDYTLQANNAHRGSTPYQYGDGVGGPTYRVDALSSGGSGEAHNNLQPYIVVYMWKRTA